LLVLFCFKFIFGRFINEFVFPIAIGRTLLNIPTDFIPDTVVPPYGTSWVNLLLKIVLIKFLMIR